MRSIELTQERNICNRSSRWNEVCLIVYMVICNFILFPCRIFKYVKVWCWSVLHNTFAALNVIEIFLPNYGKELRIKDVEDMNISTFTSYFSRALDSIMSSRYFLLIPPPPFKCSHYLFPLLRLPFLRRELSRWLPVHMELLLFSPIQSADPCLSHKYDERRTVSPQRTPKKTVWPMRQWSLTQREEFG